MGLINRFLLFLYTIAVGVLSVGAALVLLQVIPERVVLNELHYLMGNMQLQAVGVLAVVLLLSLHLLLCCFSSGSKKPKLSKNDVLIIKGENGETKLTLKAVREMVEHSILSVAGVRDVKLDCRTRELPDGAGNTISMRAGLTIGQERNAGQISDVIQDNVRRLMLQVAGINALDFEISVDSIVSGVDVKKKKRVN